MGMPEKPIGFAELRGERPRFLTEGWGTIETIMRILVTGGAGFIGSAFVRMLIAESDWRILNLDKLTYAGNLENLAEVEGQSRYRFVHGDICDEALVGPLLEEERPDAIVHFAAE